jgi:D-lactate dehydrogenase
LDRVPPAKLISIRTQSIVPANWSSDLKGILSRSEGFDHLVRYRRETRTRARLGHLSGYCSRSVAEQAVMLMLALMRKLPRQLSQLAVFDRNGLTGREVRGKNALVVGVGRIGREIVTMARGLGMAVRGTDIVKRERGVPYVPLAKGIGWADVVFIALPLTTRTEALLNYSLLSRSKRRPFVINVGRGEALPSEDLIRLLEEDRLSGAALDVFSDESVLAESLRAQADDGPGVRGLRRLMAFENVICTPHNAFNTAEALEQKCRQTIDAVKMFLAKGKFLNEA